jgi:Recombination directionality factor-like
MAALPYGIAAFDERPVRLQRGGRVRLGNKGVSQKSGKEYPRELDHFNLEDAPALQEFYGPGEVRRIPAFFPVDDARTILDLAYMAYGASGWKCRGNGVEALRRDTDTMIECLGEDCPGVKKGECKRQGRLTFLCYEVPGLRVYDFVTSSWRTIENALAFIQMLQGLWGHIDRIPFVMLREPYQTSYTDESGKQHAQTHHCVSFDVEASFLDVKRLGAGGNFELPEAPMECADDMYPKSLQERELKALGTAEDPEVIPAEKPRPLLAPHVPQAPPPDPVTPLEADIAQGFEICGTDAADQVRLRAVYKDTPEKLFEYLSALATTLSVGSPAPQPVQPQLVPPPKATVARRSPF